MENQNLLTPADVAREFGVSERTQGAWRFSNTLGLGDIVIKRGRSVFYRRADVEAWVKTNMSEDLLRPADVAREFGISLTQQKHWRMYQFKGWHEIGVKLCNKVHYRRADVEAWMKNSRKGV